MSFRKYHPKEGSLVAQMVKNPPAMWETWVQSLGWEDPLEEGMATSSSILAWKNPHGQRSLGSMGVTKSWTRLSDKAQHNIILNSHFYAHTSQDHSPLHCLQGSQIASEPQQSIPGSAGPSHQVHSASWGK